MCDTELLIKAIRKHPCLWDVGLKDYHNREIKDLAWEEVCTEVYEGRWEIASQDEKSRKCELKNVKYKGSILLQPNM